MEINESARKHGVPDVDIEHAIEYSLVEIELDDDAPRRWLVLGPSRAAMMLEVVVLVFDDGGELVIHAMPMRAKYEEMLRGDK